MPSPSSCEAEQRASRDALELTARLWHHFASCFPHRWIPAVGSWSLDNPAVQSWAMELRGITADQVDQGMKALRAQGRDWPPGAFEFAGLCRSGGIPSSADAYAEAVLAACSAKGGWAGHSWSHPTVYHAAVAVGRWELRTLPGHVAERKFADAFKRMRERWNAGESMEAPEPLALPPPAEKPRDLALAKSHLEAMLKMAGPKRGTPPRKDCPDCGGTGETVATIKGAPRRMPCMSCLLTPEERAQAVPSE